MTEFSGMVKVDNHTLSNAINNWKSDYNYAKSLRDSLIERSKSETITIKLLWVFNKTKTKYQYIKDRIKEEWFTDVDDVLCELYPDEYNYSLRSICDAPDCFDDIITLRDLYSKDVYLSVEQAAKVLKWKDKFYGI